MLGAQALTWWALSPSLLPHRWWSTALNVAAGQVIGHLAGGGLAALANLLHKTEPFQRLPRRFRRTPNGAGPSLLIHAGLIATTGISVVRSVRRQRQQAAALGVSEIRAASGLIVGLTIGTAAYATTLKGIALTWRAWRTASTRLARWLPAWGASLAAGGLVGGLWVLLADRVLWDTVVTDMSRRAERLNRRVVSDLGRPTEWQRSGSPGSRSRWSEVGLQGRFTLHNGPRRPDIEEVTGLDAREPIRVFVGLIPGRDRRAAVRLAVEELDRTGAFDRSVIHIHIPTGTGWLPDYSVEAVEFLTRGDCALVSIQYTYLTSALSFYRDNTEPVDAARLLTDAVVAAAADRGSDARIFLAGESLGAFGIGEAFPTLDDLPAAVSGIVLAGPPRFTRLTRAAGARRDVGTPERLPVIDGGRHVRVVGAPRHLTRDHAGAPYPSRWRRPRVVVAQHASDPIVWWGPELFLRRPDWLAEPGSRGVPAPAASGYDVFPGMRWIPLITGWQVGVDMLTCLSTPPGHGHNYRDEYAWYWAGVLGDAVRVPLTHELIERVGAWTHTHHRRR